MGTINNRPEIVRTVKFGQRIPLPEDDLTDWMYLQDGKIHGSETMRLLLKTLPPEEAKKLRAMLANP